MFKRENTILLSIFALGGILRIFRLSHKSLWGDEFITIKYATSSLGYIMTERFSVEAMHPPLYYILNHLIIDNSIFVLRLPSAIFGVLTVFLTYNFARRVFGSEVAVLSAFLISISPLQIFYSQFARPYTILSAVSMASLFFFNEMLRGDEKRKTRLGFVLSNVINIYTHFYAFFVVISQAVFLKKKFLKDILIIAILLLPLLYLMIVYAPSDSASAIGWNAPPSATWIPYLFYKFSIGLRRLEAFDWRIVAVVAFPVFAYPFLRGVHATLKEHKTGGRLLISYIFVPLISSFVFSLTIFPIFNFRYLTFALPAYLILIGNGIFNIKNKKIANSLVLSIAILYAYSLYEYYFVIDKNNWYLSVGL